MTICLSTCMRLYNLKCFSVQLLFISDYFFCFFVSQLAFVLIFQDNYDILQKQKRKNKWHGISFSLWHDCITVFRSMASTQTGLICLVKWPIWPKKLFVIAECSLTTEFILTEFPPYSHQADVWVEMLKQFKYRQLVRHLFLQRVSQT